MRGADRSLRGAVVWALVLGLVLGPAALTPAATVNAKVSVNSEPAGAEVLADGVAQGATPIDLALTPGEHRISVVKDGYLDNSRTVKLSANESRSLHVALTATGQSSKSRAATALQAEPESKSEEGEGGGGGKKWLWVGLGAVVLGGAGVGGYLLLKNDPPTVSTITVNPPFGMTNVTSFSFTSNAKDDKDSASELKYNWEFGDGQTATTQSPTHAYTTANSYTVQLTVTDSKDKSATATTTVTVARSIAGTWTGRVPGIANLAKLQLTQSGGTFSGTMTFTVPLDYSQPLACTGCSGVVTGTTTLAYPATVSFSTNVVGLIYNFTGTSADGSTIVGTSTWSIPSISRSGSGPTTYTRQ